MKRTRRALPTLPGGADGIGTSSATDETNMLVMAAQMVETKHFFGSWATFIG